MSKDDLVKKDYHYICDENRVSRNNTCPICFIQTFSHFHKKGTLPKDFIRGQYGFLDPKKSPLVKFANKKKLIRNVSFSFDILSLLDIQAELEHRSRSSMIEVMVINYLEKNERKSA